MSYRTVELVWMPRTTPEWTTFGASRREAGRLWNDLVRRHHRIRRLHWKWPSKLRWERWARGRYPGLSAQSARQLIGEFSEAVNSCRQLRKNGHMEARYPWRLSYGVARLICEVPDEARPQETVIGVDLGVNTLLAATDGHKVILISGRAAKATIQYRNKQLARIQQVQAGKQKGSRRHKRLQRRKYRLLDRAKRRIRDLCHKATRQVEEAFPGATCYVGEPFNDAAQRARRTQAQSISQACTRKLIQQLDYKTVGAIVIDEAYSSQTCPVCGRRSRHGRIYRCPQCKTTGPRDAIGAVNILALGIHGTMLPGRAIPQHIEYLRPWPRLRSQQRSSSGGHPACRSA